MDQELRNLSQELEGAYEGAIEARQEYIARASTYQEAKSEVNFLVAKARAEGAIQGKNEGERDANARMLFAEQFDALEAAEIAANDARLNLDVANLTLDHVRDQLRIQEISVRLPLERAA